jgi:hypothetical protein
MTRKVTRFSVPVEITYDDERSTPELAVDDFYRMLEEAEEAGLMDRQLIEISYGGDPAVFSEPEDAAPDEDEEEDDTGSSYVTGQMEPNGVYAPAAGSGTYVLRAGDEDATLADEWTRHGEPLPGTAGDDGPDWELDLRYGVTDGDEARSPGTAEAQ